MPPHAELASKPLNSYDGESETSSVDLEKKSHKGSRFAATTALGLCRMISSRKAPSSAFSLLRPLSVSRCAERFVRILKENLLWLKSFADVEELREALLAFKTEYNNKWILQAHGYKTPAQVRAEQTRSLEEMA